MTEPFMRSLISNNYKVKNFDYARESLGYLLTEFNIKELYLPYYLCDVVRHTLFKTGAKPKFYHIDDKFMPDAIFDEDSFILYPNYFGVCQDNVDYLEKIYKNLIVDNAHSYYSKPQGFACFNSVRKFKNVTKGSYLYIKNEDKSFQNECIQEKTPPKRIEKFEEFDKKFGKLNLLNFDLEKIESPFCYPLLTETDEIADKIAEELTKDGLEIFRYWNELPKSYNEYKFYRRLVPIPLGYEQIIGQ